MAQKPPVMSRQTAKELAFLAVTAIAFFTIPAIMSATKLAGWW